jgi:hypothetical protein
MVGGDLGSKMGLISKKYRKIRRKQSCFGGFIQDHALSCIWSLSQFKGGIFIFQADDSLFSSNHSASWRRPKFSSFRSNYLPEALA